MIVSWWHGSGRSLPTVRLRAFVVEAEIAVAAGRDPAAGGAAVTVELRGDWRHEQQRIEGSLSGCEDWRVVSFAARPVMESERRLGDSLLAGPRARA